MPSSFVGRDAEMSIVHSLSLGAEQDRVPAAAFVVGDPGSGKSRLLDEARARSPIGHSIRIAGFEPEGGIALAAARDLLETLKRAPDAGVTLHELMEGKAASPVEPLRIFEAAHRAAETLVPLLIAADDVHWADPSSLALLHYLVRAADAEGQCVVLLAAGRPGPRSGSFASSLRELLGDRAVELELGPLDREVSIQLVSTVNPALDRQSAEEVSRRAGGSPFWLELLARAGSTDDLQALLAERLRGSSADAVDLLATMTLAARPLLVEEPAEILGWESDRASGALRDLARSGLIVEKEGVLSLSHDLLREAVAARLPPPLRQRIHRRLAGWLELHAGDDQQLLLSALEHRAAGGLPPLDLARRLVRSPRRQLLGSEGVRVLGALVDEAGVWHEDVATGVAGLALDVGDHGEALARWAGLADRAPDPRARARAALQASRAAYQLERTETAHTYLERATASAGDDKVLAVEVEAHRSEVLRWLDHRRGPARASTLLALRKARALATGPGGAEHLSPPARRAYLHALAAATDLGLQEEDPAGILEIAQEMLAAAAGFDPEASIKARFRAGYSLFALGRAGEAETSLRLAWDESRRAALYGATLDAGWWLGRTLYHWGRLGEAEAVSRECVSLSRRLDKMSRAAATWIYAARASMDTWGRAAEALRDEVAREPDAHFRLMARQMLALVLARMAGERSSGEAAEQARLTREEADQVGCARCHGEALLRGAEALARAGRKEEARAWLAERGPPDDEPYPLAGWWHARALASIAVGGHAGSLLQTVATDAQRLGLSLEGVWARLDLGRHLTGTDRPAASKAFRDAGRAAEGLGARTEQRMAEQGLRALGVRTWRRGPALQAGEGLSPLSRREQEVASMVADGRSNPDIASALFLSRKTIERHVSNIMAKLGVRNRTELAALLGRSSVHPPEDEGAPR
jgi:DNA-binding CsgD family transcriptional regulator/tetratricopeptide (TPR) repeat protein